MLPSIARRFLDDHPLAAKVPQITVVFWVLKVLTTGMGEAMSDSLGQRNIALAAAVGLVGFTVAMALQLRARRYRAPVYWFAVMMVAVFGTMVADGPHKLAGVPYAITTPFYAAVVATTFWRWQRAEGTLSIHSITTRPRELYYWIAVLGTFALGTAAGDLTAISLHLGYLPAAALFAVAIAVPALAWSRFRLDPVLAFWAAYVITRPLGASVADWLGKPRARTGLGLGDATVSGLAFVAFVVLVAYLAVTRNDIQDVDLDHTGGHVPQPLGMQHADGAPARPQPAEG